MKNKLTNWFNMSNEDFSDWLLRWAAKWALAVIIGLFLISASTSRGSNIGFGYYDDGMFQSSPGFPSTSTSFISGFYNWLTWRPILAQ